MEQTRAEVEMTIEKMAADMAAAARRGEEAGTAVYRQCIADTDPAASTGLDLTASARRATAKDFDVVLAEPRDPDPILVIAEKRANKLLHRLGDAKPEDAPGIILDGYIRELKTIDTYKIMHFGGQASKTTCLRAYCEQFACYLAWGIASEYHTDPQLSTVESAMKAHTAVAMHASGSSEDMAWVGMKLVRLQSELEHAKLTMGCLAELDPMKAEEVAQMREENDQLWEDSKSLRKYGLASVVAPTNLTGIQEWSVLSGHDMRTMVDQATTVNLSDDELRQDISIDYDPTRYGLEYAVGVFTATNGRFADAEPQVASYDNDGRHLGHHLATELREDGPTDTAAIILDRQGELKTLAGIPVRSLCESLGCADAYEELRAEILALYSDLVVPTRVVKAMATRDREAIEANPNWDIKDRLRYLVIARRKYIYLNRDEIKQQLQQEAKMGGGDRSGTHPVGGHIREMAPHHRASPRARDQAWEDEKEILPETGFTWVRPHVRPGPPGKGRRRVLVVDGRYKEKQDKRQ